MKIPFMLMIFLLYLELFAQPGKHCVSFGASSFANMLVIALPIINIKIKKCSVLSVLIHLLSVGS
jgi:hypothetical protein